MGRKARSWMGEIGAARAKFLRASSPRLAKKEGHPVSAWVPLCVVRGSLLSAAKGSVAIHRNICYPRIAWDTMRESAKKRYKVGCLRSLQGEQLAIGAIAFSPRRKTAVLWRLALPRKSGLPVYIAPYGEPCRREGNFMSDFELLSIVLMFLGILVTVIVAYIQDTQK